MQPIWRSFNSRTHEGCDVTFFNADQITSEFQFTHPRGVRQVESKAIATYINVSIHAPTRGATVEMAQHAPGREVSIHAPTRGAT